MRKKILFIINPICNKSKRKNFEKIVIENLNHDKYEYKIYTTKAPKDATIYCENEKLNFDIIVAVGGDGTINEVASPILYSEKILGIIPTGSGNGLANYLKIPKKINSAIKLINDSKIQTIDTCTINDHFFANVAGIGFDAYIAFLFQKSIYRGFVNYIKLIILKLPKYKSPSFELKFNSKSINSNHFIISFANSSQYSVNAYIAPKAKINDGFIDICLLRKFPLIQAPILVFYLFFNKLHKSKYFESYKTKNITIHNKKNNQLKAHVDGEPIIIHERKINVNIKPKSLKIITNKNL